MQSLNLQFVVVLMPLKIEHHTAPHLKALTSSIEHESGRAWTWQYSQQHYTVMKSAILLHKWPKRWFHMTVAVSVLRVI